MWDFFIDNRRFTYLLIVVLIAFGLYSVSVIPKESAPEVQVPVGIVTTVLPGAPAVDIESQITNELEKGLAGSLENVKKITSTSKEGVSSIIVEFDASADIDKSIDSLKDKVESLISRLPTDAERPTVTEVNFVDQPIVTIAIGGDKTDEEFSQLANDLADEFETISGVSRVEKSGVNDREVTVLVDQSALLRFNLTVTDVLNSIRIANNTFPVGQIITDSVSYNIIFSGDDDSATAIGKIPVAVRGGQPVLVNDVAKVIIGLSPATSFSRLSTDNNPSETSFTLSLYKQRGGDITAIADDIQTKITLLNDSLLKDLAVYTVYDAGKDIKHDLTNLSKSGLETIVLVIIVLIIVIGWRESLIAGLSIPLSFMVGFIGLYLSGNTINFISLFALILGIGVLVDSAIVVVEGINKRLKKNPNLSNIDAAKQTVAEFSSPLTSGTLTTVGMFVGLFVVSGVTGQFISGIPFTLIFIMFASLFVALGIIPLLTAVLLKKHKTTQAEQFQSRLSDKLENWYKEVLTKIINSRKLKIRFLVLICGGLVTAIALIPAGLVKVIFFEQSNVDFIFVDIELPEGSIKESTDLSVRQVEERLYKYKNEIEAFSVTVGSGNAFGGGGSNAKLANIQVSLREDREMTSSQFIEVLRADLNDIKDVKVSVNQPSDGPPVGSAIGVKLFGDDLDSLTNTANEISQRLAVIDNVTNVSTSANSNTTEFLVSLDQEKTALYGLNPQVVSQTLRSAVFGSEATTITSLNDDMSVVVRLDLSSNQAKDPEFANWTTIDTLKNIELSTPSGERIPLSALTNTTLREASSAINHEDQKRIMSVSADVTKGGNVMEINTKLQKEIDENLTLPEGVSYTIGGEAEESNKSFMELILALVVGIVLMIIVLVIQFDSYRHTLYVLSILPFSLIGILYGLAITGSSLSFPSIMGFIALSGIIVNNSILLIDMMNRMRNREPEKSIRQVVIDASVSRLRPIVLTSVTTIMGMTPLLFTDDLWIPLASAVIFGLAFSVVITLLLVPIIYSKWPGKVNSRD